MSYTPNFENKQCLKRLRGAYGFCRAFLSPKNPTPLAKKLLDTHFGCQSHPLSKWLREKLLICTKNFYSADKGQVKEYVLNEENAIILRAELIKNGALKSHATTLKSKSPSSSLSSSQFQYPIQYHSVSGTGICTQSDACLMDFALFDIEVAREFVRREFADDLKSLSFTYNDKSNRWWHPLQNVKSTVRTDVLSDAGLKFHYDIASCAPTLILQHAQHQGMDEYLFGLTDYLKNKNNFREHVQRIGLIEDPSDAKVLINALFCGARLGNNRDFALFHVLHGNRAGIKALQEDARLNQLKADIKTCWDAIEPSLPKIFVTSEKTGRTRKKALSSKRKWGVYFELERTVMSAVREYLKTNGLKFFLIHDGWACDTQLDVVALQEFILQNTGFAVSVST